MGKESTKAKATEDTQHGSARIRKAALDLFTARGFHGSSMRDLAQAVRVEPASLYYHYPSKQDILAALFDQTMDALLEGLDAAVASGETPEQKLRAVVRSHVLFHIARQDEAFLSHSELRSLTPANRRRVIAKRDRYERTLRELLAEGVETGGFQIPDIPMTSTAILVMCSGVSDWFARKGRLTAEDVVERYADMVMRLVGKPKPRARRTRAAGAPR